IARVVDSVDYLVGRIPKGESIGRQRLFLTDACDHSKRTAVKHQASKPTSWIAHLVAAEDQVGENSQSRTPCRMSRNGPCLLARNTLRARRGDELRARTWEVRMLVPVRDTRLFCDIVGNGPAVLAFHGGPGLDHRYFRPWLDPLGEAARMIFFDLRGHGRSDG